MILEGLAAFIKTLPAWLASVAEVLIVAILFMTAFTFLAGLWCGMRIIGKRATHIEEIQFVPPKIVFRHDDHFYHKKDEA